MSFEFDDSCKEVVMELSKRLSEAPIVQSPNLSKLFELMCNALDYALDALLVQQINKFTHVISYASRTLYVAQSHYTTTEKELLAIIFALDKVQDYLLGYKVVVLTDHACKTWENLIKE